MFLLFFLFLFLRALLLTGVRQWQILVKIMFQSLFGSLLNHLYHYANENVSVKHLSLICITSILTTIYSLKNCSVYGRSCRIYSPKSFGFFRKEFRQVKKKYVIYRLRVGPYGEKLWPRSWKCCIYIKTSIIVFHHTNLPAGKLTYIYFFKS